jgi:FKBP-type peptidyl-prolyl cis-trans isomerase FkpA
MKYVYLGLTILALAITSCQKGKEMKTGSGFKYILYTESKGEKPKQGDYVTILMSYKNDKDSVMFDWKTAGQPVRFQLERIPFKGSFEDGLTYLSENDSATFFVPADSLYKTYYAQTGKSQQETGFIPGTYMKFDIRLLKVQSPEQAEEEMMLKQIKEEKHENELIKAYIAKNNITVAADTSGYYLVIREKGKGEKVETGKVVAVEYKGKFLNDSIFDESKGEPYKFIMGAHRVIPGWEKAMMNLNVGDKITLLVPSKLGYGIDGLRNPSTSEYAIAPNTPLVFDIELIAVEDVPAVSNK